MPFLVKMCTPMVGKSRHLHQRNRRQAPPNCPIPPHPKPTQKLARRLCNHRRKSHVSSQTRWFHQKSFPLTLTRRRTKYPFKMATFYKVLALLGVAFVLSVGSRQESWGQSQTLTAFYTAPVVSMAPMWIAKEAGFFKKQGLDVRLVFIPSGPTGTTAILAGEADVGIIGGFAPTRAFVGGAKNLVIIGQCRNFILGAIVGKKEIASVQDLKGKRLGIDRIGSNPDMYTQAALSRFQMDPL